MINNRERKEKMFRCPWAGTEPLYLRYHDEEWGVPRYDDNQLFELLILEGMQAGLSWITILKKRESYRLAFDHFHAWKIAAYDNKKAAELLNNPGIIRNRLKIAAAIGNAQAFLNVQTEFGSFSKYIWQFVGNSPKINSWKGISEIPTRTDESDQMSKDLYKRGFKFVGSTICYAFMQAVGMVNDHLMDCFRYSQINSLIHSSRFSI
jgi:DNA-3-methyladenine glycosylase I